MVLDSHLLVLLVVGSMDRDLISKHKRTRQFLPEDFELLLRTLAQYDKVHITPHVVTEASNLIGQIGEPRKTELQGCLGLLIPQYSEHFKSSKELAARSEFARLGLTDCAILELVAMDNPLVTVDLDLYLTALRWNSNVVNFNHLRQASLMNL